MDEMIKKNVIFSIIFILVGLGLALFGFKQFSDYNEKKSTYVEVSAKVVEHEYGVERDEGGYAIYEYTVEGVTYRAKSDVKTTNLPYIGKEVTIMYNPDDPNDVIVDAKSSFILLFVGIIFAVVGAFALFKSLSLKDISSNMKFDNTNINDVAGPNGN